METQAPPSKIARLADSSIVQASCLSMERNGSSGGPGSPTVCLGLALGHGSGSTDNRTIPALSTAPNGFTILQLQELQLQSLIYKYIEAGFPVPYNLVLPIWKSVSSPLNSSLHQLYPTLMVGSSQMQWECRNGMDPEPGRCRRTDGKKWRCSKEALPDQKYCERHMHRGRQRSRKLVEAASQTNTSNSNTSTNLSISLPLSTEL
ncbi:hypothetical protein JCGZ_20720 [Jatropha curcas]|uniref:Growth-regulating factor n=1 Tax=Jatropha curcas TaxID=180498 RepID=A0A067K194_JATCU|nr:hypothetical protein JCGZ_20720 [Jatropha curcas]